MAGSGSGGARYRARHLQRSRRTGGKRTSPGSGGAVRLVVCGVIFVALVAVKLLFPQTVSRLAQSAGQLIGRDADFKEAFAAMGRAISGEEPVGDSLQEAYTAVFSPSSSVPVTAGAEEALPAGTEAERQGADPVGESARSAVPQPSAGEPGDEDGEEEKVSGTQPPEAEPVQTSAQVPSEPETAQTESGAPVEPEDTATATVSYVYTMPALPDNASLEQRNLGFDHTSPIVGALTSTFGWREHPITGGNKFHYGVDLAGEMGDDICAFADGRVYATGESSTLGKYIMLQHDEDYITLYAHCSQVTALSGEVSMGDKIAEVGDTGMATGPHLHFELHSGELYLNPLYYVELG